MQSFPEIVEEDAGLRPIPVGDLRHWWGSILVPLSKLLKERGEYRPADILKALNDHRMQLWTGGYDSFAITQVSEYPTKRILTVLFAGGNLQVIASNYVYLEAWARERGCDEIRVHGREGWERVFHMERLGVVLRREL